MELPLRLEEASQYFDQCWGMLHKCDDNKENARHSLYWLKKINAVIEDLEASILGLEKALTGDTMPKKIQIELDEEEKTNAMIKKWLPIIIYGELNGIKLNA